MPVIERKYDKYGNLVDYEFNPTGMMIYVVHERAKPQYRLLPEKRFLETLKRDKNAINLWRFRYDIKVGHDLYIESMGEKFLFSNWWNEELETQQAEMVSFLSAIGKSKASREFPYWKELSRTYGVIKPEQIQQTNYVIPIDLGRYDEFTPEQIEGARDKLLDSLCAVEDKKGAAMALPSDEQSESPADRTDELPEGSMVLSNTLGKDG